MLEAKLLSFEGSLEEEKKAKAEEVCRKVEEIRIKKDRDFLRLKEHYLS